jgi:hypothetical protein
MARDAFLAGVLQGNAALSLRLEIMNILKREEKECKGGGRVGTITVDEVPPDVCAGDVIVETFPGQCFVEKIPFDLDAMIFTLESLIREKQAEIQDNEILKASEIG